MNSFPLVSIYIPTRNRVDLLKRAVLSCLQQEYRNIEIIIVDDASDPEQQKEIQKLATLDSRITLLQHLTPEGASAARNTAINKAKGEFITGLDDDDAFTPSRIKIFLEAWYNHSEYAFLCSGYRVFLPERKSYCYGRKPMKIGVKQLRFANYTGNQVFTKTAYLKKIGGFCTELVSYQDYDTWLRLATQFGDGYRIAGFTYLVYQDHHYERITSAQRTHRGFEQFLARHRHDMTEAQLKTQYFNLKLHSDNTTPWELLKSAPWHQLPRVIKVLVMNWIKKC